MDNPEPVNPMTPGPAGHQVTTITEQTFEREVISTEVPVLVAFLAAWSNPCKLIEPDLVALKHELEGKAKVVRVDVDQSPALAQEFQLKGIPAFAVVQQGRVVVAKQGMMRRDQLRQLIDPFLPRSEAAIRVEDMIKLMKAERVLPIDTRDAASFSRAHIPGAMHLPLADIEAKADELASTGKAPVLYDRSGLETKAIAEKLAEQGYPVAFLEGGFLAWEIAGQTIERS